MSDEKKGMDLEGVQVGDRKKNKVIEMPKLPKALTLEEKRYLLAVERGDTPNVRRILQKAFHKKHIDIDCMDSLGRGALLMAIDNENLEMLELLVVMGVTTKDSLLHAINVEFVEAVELLLQHEELIHKEGEPHSWEKVDSTTATFAPDITPLTLAAHRDNFEIIKILLDRGATLPMPHDIKCGCDECIAATREDSLRHSLARVNAYRALASPSLIALSSNDPIQTAFELSWELRNLAFTEQECKSEYLELRRQCQQFAVDLLSHTRGSKELAIVLNHDPNAPPYEDGEHMKLARLEMAINFKQKKFVAHPNIQQLLAALWYEGVPGFRRLQASQKLMEIVKVAALFPFYCMLYMFMPNCKTAKLMRKPFMKFLIHASSYLFFLLLLILVSQRAEVLVVQLFGTKYMKEVLREQLKQQRGNGPTMLELSVVFYVFGFIYEETKEIVREGIGSYLRNMWNIIDFTRNSLYVAVMMLRSVAYFQQRSEIARDPALAFVPREHWDDFDPQLIAEGLFAAANIFSALKLVHLFSINPHLGPLQISLGRMVIDIVKFFFIYSLVLFAFACGLNQLLWYFAELERQKCYHLPGEMPDWANNGDACMKWRRFGNLFESSQSLFWASFGMVGLESFELTGIKSYTRFWGLLMFGSYSVINVIVLLNLLIAMMSNSYAAIVEHSDVEWKFARTRLWMSYFEESATLPPPFNILPAPKHALKLLGMREKDKVRRMSTKRAARVEKERDYRYTAVMRALVWRYVAAMHRKFEENPVTEDDINEIKSEITAMRYDIIDVLGKNGMDISHAEMKDKAVVGKKMRVWERRLMKDFHVAPVAGEETVEELQAAVDPPENEDSLAKFRRLAKLAVLQSSSHKWGEVVRDVCKSSQIGRSCNRESFRNQQYLQRAMDEARKLQNMKPMRGHSPTPSPIPIIDPTRDGILSLIKEIREETGTTNTGTSRPPSSNNLLGVTPKPSRASSPAMPALAAAVSQKRAEVNKEVPLKSAAPKLDSTSGNPQEFVFKHTNFDERSVRPVSPQSRGAHPEFRVHNNSAYLHHQTSHNNIRSQGVNRLGHSPIRSRHENCLLSQVDSKINADHKQQQQAVEKQRVPQKQQKDDIILKYPEHKYYVERGVKHEVPEKMMSDQGDKKTDDATSAPPLAARHDQVPKVVKRKPPPQPGNEQTAPAQSGDTTGVHHTSQPSKQESIAIPRPRADVKNEAAPGIPAPESRQQPKSADKKPADVKPAMAKPVESKPAETKSVKPTEVIKPSKPTDLKPLEPAKAIIKSSKVEISLPTVEVTASTPLPHNKFSSTEKLIPVSEPASPDMSSLGAGQKVDNVSTIKRQPKTGWL